MAQEKRSPRRQSQHDQFVSRSAAHRKATGKTVQADVPGFPRPDSFGGHRPDIVEKRGGRVTKIIEVETPDTVSSDRKQQEALRRAAERMGAEFEIKVAGRRGPKRR